MAATSPPQSKPGPFGALVVVALVLVLAWQLAHWTWVFFAPASVSQDNAAESSVDLALAARLFGGTSSGVTGASANAGLRLKGVIAPTPGVAASAIFSTGSGKDVPVFLGEEVQKGVKLAEVHPDHVIVSRAGVETRIDLEAPHSMAPAAGSRPSRAVGFKLNVARSGANSFALSRKELDEALRDPNQLNYLGQIGMPPGGGVRMDAAPAGSLAQKLGLQPGDVIRKLNGQAVASPGDLARLYQQFASLSTIQAEIQRGGAIVQLSYAINP